MMMMMMEALHPLRAATRRQRWQLNEQTSCLVGLKKPSKREEEVEEEEGAQARLPVLEAPT
jgi:hypothetical protein